MNEKDIKALKEQYELGYYTREVLKKDAFEEKYKDQPNPENAYEEDGFYYVYTAEYPFYTLQEFLLIKQIKLLSTIRNILVIAMILAFVVPFMFR